MELKVIGKVYHCPQFSLYEGETTEKIEGGLSEEKKQQMLADFPALFQKIEGVAQATKVEVSSVKKGK